MTQKADDEIIQRLKSIQGVQVTHTFVLSLLVFFTIVVWVIVR